MKLSESEILSIISDELPGFNPQGPLQKLEGGNLNYVWRLEGAKKSLIVKAAPPYIASNPEMPLNVDRIQFEANALRLFNEGSYLHSLISTKIRPPNVAFYNHENNLLVMEDIGAWPHLGAADLNNPHFTDFGGLIGKFIAKLHSRTFEDEKLVEQFNNIQIQQTRFEVQYSPAAEYLKKMGLGDVDSNLVSQKTKALGQALLESGRCLVMGDLWPPSILVDETNLRIIDWEFVHFGRPLQDIGHFAAHCWMMAHTASRNNKKGVHEKLWDSFWQAYQRELEPAVDSLIDKGELGDMATHAGAEILVRATGPFKEGYVYEAYDDNHPIIGKAGQKATQLILGDDLSLLWT